MDVFNEGCARQSSFTTRVLQMYSMVALLLTLLLLPTPTAAQTADRCDNLYAAAQEARADVRDGLGKPRLSDAEKRQWRRATQRLAQTSERARACYDALLPPVDAADSSPADPPEETALPTPTSRALQRLQKTYEWTTLAYRELQAYDTAFQEFDRFFGRFGAAADSSRIAFMYNSRGYLHYTLGNLTESIDDYARTIAYTPAADTLDRADLMMDLGTILQKINDLSTAQSYYARAEHLARGASASEDQRETLGRALFNQGDILKHNRPGDTEAEQTARARRAVDLLQQAINLSPDPGNDRLARMHIILADAYRMLGNLESARRHVERGRSIAASFDSAQRSQADVLTLAERVRGRIEFTAGRLDAAVASFTKGLRFAESGRDQSRRYSLLEDLGEVHEHRGDPARAETYYRRAIAVSNEVRAALRATEWASFTSSDWSAPRRGLMRVLLAQDRPREAFLALDRSRARHLQDRQLQTRLTSTLPLRQRVRFDSLTAELADIRNALATDNLSPDGRSMLKQDEVQLMVSRRALLDLDETAALSSVATLQAQLEAQQRALVTYHIDGADRDHRAPTSHAFVVTPNTFRAVPLALNADTLRARLAAVSPLLRNDTERVSINAVNFDLATLHRLHEDLFAPVADALPDGLPLTIIPDGPLFRLPFSMLVTEPVQGWTYDRAPYLLRDRPIAMELSAALLSDTTRPASDLPLDIAALGRTRFEAVSPLPPALRARLDSTGSLPALPGVQRELDALRDQFARRQILVDDEATERRIRTLQSRTQILHLASHALIHPSDPLANLFVLSPDASTAAQDDGLLFVHELGAQHTPVPLVVLSGCGTAQGLLRTGEGPQGLQYAFRSTGAKSTLSTLWDAEDQATVALTRSFYDHLIDGAPKDVALQQAQLDLIERFPNRASPFFWASAVLYGTPESLSLEPAAPVPLLPVAAGGLILLLIALGFGYSRYRHH